MIEIKKQLIALSSEQIKKRIQNIETALIEIETALTNETKSSAGDKFETSRAMLQAEQDRYNGQLNNAKNIRNELKSIEISQKQSVVKGSLVQTDKFNFFIAVGIGKINFNSNIYLIISPTSPIGKILIGKKVNEKFEFNGITQEIIAIA